MDSNDGFSGIQRKTSKRSSTSMGPWCSLHRSLSLVQYMDHRAEQQSDLIVGITAHTPTPNLPPSQLDSTSAAALGLSRPTSDLCKDVTVLHVSLGLSRSTSDSCKDVTLLHVSLGLSRPTSDLCRDVTMLHVYEKRGHGRRQRRRISLGVPSRVSRPHLPSVRAESTCSSKGSPACLLSRCSCFSGVGAKTS